MSAPDNEIRAVDAADARSGLVFVAAAALAYSALHIGFRLLASSTLGEDDMVENILLQELHLGYASFPRQPPLYGWVLWLVQQVTGPRVESFLLVKYACLIATACFIYLSALRVLQDRLFAILSVEALALIYQISWRFHEGFTHEVGAMVAVTATLLAILRAIESRKVLNVIALGVVVGLGVLTEPFYSVYVLALLTALNLQPAIRAKLMRAELLVSVVIAAAIASPYLWWLATDPAAREAISIIPSADVMAMLKGLKDGLRGPIAYLSPLLFIVPILFSGFVSTAWADVRAKVNKTDKPDFEQAILHATLIAWAAVCAGHFIFAIRGIAIHVFMPLYITSVIWLLGVARRASGTPLNISRFTRLALAIAVIALVARLANMFVLDPVCKTCRWGIPYEGLAQEMRARGFANGTIVSAEHEVGGNLRQHFPRVPLVGRGYGRFTPAKANMHQGLVVFVWDPKLSDEYVQRILQADLPAGRSASEAERWVIPWKHLWRPTGYRTSTWRVLIVDMDDGGRVIGKTIVP